jgi:hypothetical protein
MQARLLQDKFFGVELKDKLCQILAICKFPVSCLGCENQLVSLTPLLYTSGYIIA